MFRHRCTSLAFVILNSTTRETDVGCAYNKSGSEKSMTLLGFHAFTACDLTGRFNGFSIINCFDKLLKSNPFVHKAFASMGNNDDGLKEEIIDGLIKFVLDLYQNSF